MEEDNHLVVSDTDLSDHEQNPNPNPNPPPTRSNLFLLRTPIQSPNGTPSKKKRKKKPTTTTNTSTASPIQLVQSQADNADNSGGTPTKKRRKKRRLKHTNNGGDIGDDAPHMLHLNSPPNPNPNTDTPPNSAPANVIVNAKKKKKKPNNNGDNVDHALMPINCSTESPVEDVQNNNNNNTTPTHPLTSEVMGYLKHIVKVDQDYERFEATYPFLNNVLEREGGKTLFMEKLLSVEKSELDQMESEFKNISLMQLEARKRGTQVILKLHTKWLGE